MATVGLRAFALALLDPKTHQVISGKDAGLTESGVFIADLRTSKGATTANMANLTGTVTKKYGSNGVAYTSTGAAEPTVTLGANDLPHDILDKCLGRVANGKGMALQYNKTNLPDLALLIATDSLDDDFGVFFSFFNGNVSLPSYNVQTNNQSAQETNDSMTYTSIARASDGAAYGVFYGADTGFDSAAMMNEVFPGATEKEIPGFGMISGNDPTDGQTA
ncbi:hypothetical protein IV38_GL001960 [Lactobacillus selangorensis]|uniref:Phage major tail protein n=1 Tax=Lactobacillus selangorensis TaxID=81857 RepID=A0A0R2FGL7_9LACO|nr:major tail protein [Lactobacillus selangorensis]KRN27746.1 hypothetical protein IV38_GL001960 [Lactobacillus selangorensis]KRN30289.1 hypothetical protein IV40_GL001877 [Lactobacillus selangorensis]